MPPPPPIPLPDFEVQRGQRRRDPFFERAARRLCYQMAAGEGSV